MTSLEAMTKSVGREGMLSLCAGSVSDVEWCSKSYITSPGKCISSVCYSNA